MRRREHLEQRLRAASRSGRLMLVAWVATRALIVALIFGVADGDVARLQDVAFYLQSAEQVRDTGAMPATELWQYPPGALLAVLPPLLAGGGMAYATAFVGFMLACDGVVSLLLARCARQQGSPLGIWAWLLVFPGMREFTLLRFDLLPTLLAAVALVLLLRRPVLFGAVAGLGALVKAWPIVLVAAQRGVRGTLVALVSAIAVLVVGVLAAGSLFGDQGGVLDNQAARGLQQEAVAATWWHAQALVAGGKAPLAYELGSIQVDTATADRVATALGWAAVVAAMLLAGWWLLRVREAPEWARLDFLFVGVLLMLVTSRVFSPQFLLWALLVGAAAVSRPQSRMRRPFVLLALASLLSAGILNFPALLVLRNVLFVVVVADAVQLLVRQPAAAVRLGRSHQAAATSAAPTSR